VDVRLLEMMLWATINGWSASRESFRERVKVNDGMGVVCREAENRNQV